MLNPSHVEESGSERASTDPRRGTALVYVRDTLRHDILTGALAGGTRLAQTDIAKQLGVSTTPVREALRDLASEGLVTIDPHRGGFVIELNRDDLVEIYQIRHALEPLALRIALPQITGELIEHLDQLDEDMRSAPNVAAWVELNSTFHMSIYAASGRSRLLSTIRSLQDASVMAAAAQLSHTAGVREEANQEHSELVDAIRCQDVEHAVALLQAHLARPVPL